MRTTWKWIAAVGIGVVMGCVWGQEWSQRAWSAPNTRTEAPEDLSLVTVNTPTGENLVVLDRARRVMAVYRIEENGAAVHLRSVRDIRWDLMLEEFNPANPRPADVRAMIERQ